MQIKTAICTINVVKLIFILLVWLQTRMQTVILNGGILILQEIRFCETNDQED